MAKYFVSVQLFDFDTGLTTKSAFPLIFYRATKPKIARDARRKFKLTAVKGTGHWIGNEYTFMPTGKRKELKAVVPLAAVTEYNIGA